MRHGKTPFSMYHIAAHGSVRCVLKCCACATRRQAAGGVLLATLLHPVRNAVCGRTAADCSGCCHLLLCTDADPRCWMRVCGAARRTQCAVLAARFTVHGSTSTSTPTNTEYTRAGTAPGHHQLVTGHRSRRSPATGHRSPARSHGQHFSFSFVIRGSAERRVPPQTGAGEATG
jgi:hypothetical protein